MGQGGSNGILIVISRDAADIRRLAVGVKENQQQQEGNDQQQPPPAARGRRNFIFHDFGGRFEKMQVMDGSGLFGWFDGNVDIAIRIPVGLEVDVSFYHRVDGADIVNLLYGLCFSLYYV